jgi:hypothetical protein
MSAVDVVEMLTGMYCMRWYSGREDDGSEVPKFKKDGSREGWPHRIASPGPQSLTGSQRGRLARDARRKALSAFTYSQPSQQAIRRVEKSQVVPRVKCESARDAPVVSSISRHLKCGAPVRRVRSCSLPPRAAHSPWRPNAGSPSNERPSMRIS